jgi:FHS family L-fucose permease-like MFS transporter
MGTAVIFLTGVFVPSIVDAEIKQVFPLMFIALAIFAVAFVVIMFTQIPESAPQVATKSETSKVGPMSFRHFVLGAVAIFIYVGVEVGIPNVLQKWLQNGGLSVESGAEGIAATVAATYWLLMLVGRLLGGMLAGKVSSRAQITGVSIMCLVLVLLGMFLPSDVMVKMPGIDWATLTVMTAQVPVGIFALILVGLCTSVMWGGIFNMAVEGLGKYTSIASGAFMTMVCGGGILIPLQGKLADVFGDFQMSYIVVLVCAAYILFYALIGSKNVNKDIPTE